MGKRSGVGVRLWPHGAAKVRLHPPPPQKHRIRLCTVQLKAACAADCELLPGCAEASMTPYRGYMSWLIRSIMHGACHGAGCSVCRGQDGEAYRAAGRRTSDVPRN